MGLTTSTKLARDSRAMAIAGGDIVSVRDGVWARDGNNFIYIGRVNGEDELKGVTIWQFDQEKNSMIFWCLKLFVTKTIIAG